MRVTPNDQTRTYNTGETFAGGADQVTVSGSGLLTGHTLDGVTLALATDNQNVGTYPSGVKVTALSVKKGTDDVSQNYEVVTDYGKLTITQKGYAANAGDFSIGSADDQTYNGSAQTPAVTISDNGITLTEGTDFSTSYSGNTTVGTATVDISFSGN